MQFLALKGAKLLLVAVCRRCKHEHVINSATLIERFGENRRAIDIHRFLRSRVCHHGS